MGGIFVTRGDEGNATCKRDWSRRSARGTFPQKSNNDSWAMPPRSRAKLAERLLESLDDPKQQEFYRLWAEEVEDRIDAYEQGSLKVIPGKEVFRRFKPRKRK